MDLSPSTDFKNLIPPQSACYRMSRAWRHTGQHLKQAIDQFADEQNKKT